MGGKALNRYGVHTERKDTGEFLRIGKEIQDSLRDFMTMQYRVSVETAVVTCYRTKPNHGDLDLLVKISPEVQAKNINYHNLIDLFFLPKAIYSNGGVHSFDYHDFQVDFIPIPEEKWATALVYFSYDPLGNIMGKTYHKFNLSYGWEGLFYKYRNAHGTNSANILLTNDVKRIFEFGGYDYDRYLNGFDTLEEIFRFCIDGKYFDTEMFQMENLKSIDKKRNRKRGSYHLFLQYLKDNNINRKHEFSKNKEDYVFDIETAFPESELGFKLRGLKLIDETNRKISEKFNGNVVMQWISEIQGKELGQAIGKFKNFVGVGYDSFILNSDIEDIRDLFMKTYNGEK